MINLNLGDCVDAMSKMEDNSYDLAIVDPPYGIGRDGHRGVKAKKPKHNWKPYTFKNWDNNTPDTFYFDELERVSKNQIIWGANYFVKHLKRGSMGWIVWDKGQKLTMSDGEIAYTSFNRALRIHTINRSAISHDGSIHPTQKPVALYKWLLKNYANEGDKILDTHLGSGSIAIACHDGGFSLDAWEIDAEYHKAATERFNTHIKQLRLL